MVPRPPPDWNVDEGESTCPVTGPLRIETIVDFLERGIEVSREFRTRLQAERAK
jgi:hypothetical protein